MSTGKTVFHDAVNTLIREANGDVQVALLSAKKNRNDGTTAHDKSFWRAVVGLMEARKREQEGLNR